MVEDPTQERRGQMIDRLAERIARRGLAVPVVLLLDLLQPMRVCWPIDPTWTTWLPGSSRAPIVRRAADGRNWLGCGNCGPRAVAPGPPRPVLSHLQGAGRQIQHLA